MSKIIPAKVLTALPFRVPSFLLCVMTEPAATTYLVETVETCGAFTKKSQVTGPTYNHTRKWYTFWRQKFVWYETTWWEREYSSGNLSVWHPTIVIHKTNPTLHNNAQDTGSTNASWEHNDADK